MTRASARRWTAAAAVVLAAGTLASCRSDGGLRRIVLVSIDTLRADHLGAYGYGRPTSPHLDAFAREGVVFDDVMAPAPWTLPSHASMLTGLYPSRHGLKSHDARLPDAVTTLAAELARRGFATAAVVNSNNLDRRYGFDRGFGEYVYVPEEVGRREPTSRVVDQALAWLRQYADRPLFLFVHTYDVHSDYRSRPEYEARFVRPYAGPADGTTFQLNVVRAGGLRLGAADAGHLIDLYDAGIRQVDDEIARLLAALPADGRTLVVLTSDHGEEFLEHGGVLHGRTQYQEVLRVPLCLRGPGIPAGRRVAAPVSLVDVMPTVLAAAGAPAPPDLDGVDLAAYWRGPVDPAARTLFGEADHHNEQPDVMRAVRRAADKLHVDRATGAVALYDLATDPGEHADVAGRRPDVVAALRAQLDVLERRAVTPPTATPLDPEQRERLRGLGYLQ